jgi:archaellum component FlaC
MSFEDIDKALDIETTPIKSEIVKTEPAVIKKHEESPDQLQKDYEYSRGQLYSIIEKGQEAINGILELAQESDSPRAYEVAGQLIKNVGDVTDKLIDLQKKMKDINQEQKGSAPTNVTNNAVFLGSTAELQKFLKSSMNQDPSK